MGKEERTGSFPTPRRLRWGGAGEEPEDGGCATDRRDYPIRRIVRSDEAEGGTIVEWVPATYCARPTYLP